MKKLFERLVDGKVVATEEIETVLTQIEQGKVGPDSVLEAAFLTALIMNQKSGTTEQLSRAQKLWEKVTC
jgi:anthranilate phosphoribosyltransferase